jgi:hypothetical protein
VARKIGGFFFVSVVAVFVAWVVLFVCANAAALRKSVTTKRKIVFFIIGLPLVLFNLFASGLNPARKISAFT